MRISIFGSTGSIGKSAIDIIKSDKEKYEIGALIAKNDVSALAAQAIDLDAEIVVIENESLLPILKEKLKEFPRIKVYSGFESVCEISKLKCDLFISAAVGSAGLIPTINAIKAGSNIALANKESLVCAGELMLEEAKKNNVKIIPIDSEHNAIFQVFENDNAKSVESIVLTASGGPFFGKNKDKSTITVDEALNHPKWKMGKKVTIDSATMMNKGIEMIEAFHLFPVSKDQIKVVIHPQSIVHGMVNYEDGSSLAALSNPDMRVPISYALSYPKRIKNNCERLDLAKIGTLSFFEPDEVEFPSLKICRSALESGGICPAILNAANEIAVESFLAKKILFSQITDIVYNVMQSVQNHNLTSIEDVLECDLEARNLASKLCDKIYDR